MFWVPQGLCWVLWVSAWFVPVALELVGALGLGRAFPIPCIPVVLGMPPAWRVLLLSWCLRGRISSLANAMSSF